MQAMIFAAGLGTRLKPLTDTMPKALVKVGNKPLLWHTINKLKASGVDRIVVNVHHFSNQIISYLESHDFGVDITISDETDKLLDTGGGLYKARSQFRQNEDILIHNVDILSDADLSEFYHEAPLMVNHGSEGEVLRASATLLVTWRKTKRYLLFDADMRLVGWTNIATGQVKSPYRWLREFAAENPQEFTSLLSHHDNIAVEHRLLGYGHTRLQAYAFSGIHCFAPSLFDRMSKRPEKFPIIDFYLDNCSTCLIKGSVGDDVHLLDVGKLDTLHQAEDFVAEKR